jgi:hypothetical protein
MVLVHVQDATSDVKDYGCVVVISDIENINVCGHFRKLYQMNYV